MVEVFKTDVQDRALADLLLRQIHQTFRAYSAHFDLEDCDRILRVECRAGFVQDYNVIELLAAFGQTAQVLPDDVPAEEVWFAENRETLR